MAEATGESPSKEHDKPQDFQKGNGKKERQVSIWSDVITVITENTEFIVHRHKIFRTSELMRKACSGQWIEARERAVILDHMPAKYFAIYVDWVYHKALGCSIWYDAPFDGWMDDSVVEPQRTAFQIHYWCKLWVYADFLGDKGLKAFCLMAIERHVECPNFSELLPETIELVLNETSERSELQRMMRYDFVEIPDF